MERSTSSSSSGSLKCLSGTFRLDNRANAWQALYQGWSFRQRRAVGSAKTDAKENPIACRDQVLFVGEFTATTEVTHRAVNVLRWSG
jgi:hypothetical protein